MSCHLRYKRVHVFLLFGTCIVLVTWAQRGDRRPIDQTAPPEHWEIRSAPVRSPEETLKTFELPEGFRAEIVAAEPVIQDPIAIAFGLDGRIWAIEYPSYNWTFRNELYGEEEQAPPGRVVILEDADRDGRMDRRTVFLDGLNAPRAVALIEDGVIVSDPPHIWFCRDTDGDGKADEKRIVADDLGLPGNPHAAPSGLLCALDNWVYSLRHPARFRFTREGWTREATYVTPGQWGISQDDYGRFFYGYNQDHLRADLIPSRYFSRNPNLRELSGSGVDVQLTADQTVWPHATTPGVNRRAHLREDGTLRIFTANSGPVLYRGDHFPAEFYGNVFVCEPAANLVRRSVLSEEEGIITARNAYEKREFLFSRDERFRPVHAHTGSDGALYIVDMYRGIIEGYIFITTFLRNQILDRELHKPFHGMGRIYRIIRDDAPRPRMPQTLDFTPVQWVEYLSHRSGWWRDTAQRRIVESEDRTVASRLRELAVNAEDPRTRIHALWTLEGLGELDWRIVERALGDQSFRVQETALRLSEPWISQPDVLSQVRSFLEDEKIEVRRQALLSLGESQSEEAEQAILAALKRGGAEPFMIEAAVSGLHGREFTFLERVLDDPYWSEPRAENERLLIVLSTAIFNEGRAERVGRLIDWIDGTRAQPVWKRQALLQGLETSAGTAFSELPDIVSRLANVREPVIKRRFDEMVSAREKREQARVSRPLTTEERIRFEAGEKQFALCGACHRPDGQGLPGVAPPLVNSPRVLGSEDVLIRITLNGIDARDDYPEMPPMHGFTDEQIASVLTYIRRAWGNQAEPVGVGRVVEVRKATAGRSAAWTQEELEKVGSGPGN